MHVGGEQSASPTPYRTLLLGIRPGAIHLSYEERDVNIAAEEPGRIKSAFELYWSKLVDVPVEDLNFVCGSMVAATLL